VIIVETVPHSAYVPQLTTLFNLVFNKQWPSELWAWKHLSNPLNEPNPSIVVALDDGRVVGARPLLRVNLRYGGCLVKAAVPCDTMVHPNYRRHGLFSRMNELAIETERAKGTALLFNFPNRISGAGYLKQGWKEVTALRDLILMLNPRKVARSAFDDSLLSGVAAAAFRVLLGGRAFRQRPATEGIVTAVCDRYADVPPGIPTLYDPHRIELLRDSAFMVWRLDNNPIEDHHYVVALDGGRLVGYMVLAVSRRLKGLKQGWILDCLVQDYDIHIFSSLITTAVSLLGDLGCDYVRAWGVQHPGFSAFLARKMGFWAVPLPLLGRAAGDRLPRLVARPIASEQLDDGKLLDISNWNLSPLFRDPT